MFMRFNRLAFTVLLLIMAWLSPLASGTSNSSSAGCFAQAFAADGKQLLHTPDSLPLAKPSAFPLTSLRSTLIATADSTIMEGYPSQNFGAEREMWAGYDDYLDPDGKIVRGLIAFDLGGLPDSIRIVRATLRLFHTSSWDYPNRFRTVRTYRLAAPWTQDTVTWQNAPPPLEAYGEANIMYTAGSWYEFDVTDLVKLWHSGAQPNNGLMIRGPEESGTDSAWRGFSTREGPYPPELVIEYEVPDTPTPTATRSPTSTPTRTRTATATATVTPTPALFTPRRFMYLPLILKLASLPRATPTPTRTPGGGPCAGQPTTPYFTLYYGSVTINGAPAPIGTLVEMFSPRGERVGCAVTMNVGVYPYTMVFGADSAATPPIPGMLAGEAVTFRVNQLNANTNPPLVLWQNDRTTHRVDLSIGTSP